MEFQVITRQTHDSLFFQERRVLYRLEGGEEPAAAPWRDEDDLRWAVRHWASRMSLKSPQVQIRRMTTKWASISSRGRLTLNSDLLELPRGLGEYVVVHELVHLLVPNHGLVFKLFLDAYMPDWRERDQAVRNLSESI